MRAQQCRAANVHFCREVWLFCESWLGGLDSNQDNQIQNLMYCQLYDLPPADNKKGRGRDLPLLYWRRNISSTARRNRYNTSAPRQSSFPHGESRSASSQIKINGTSLQAP